MGILAGGDRVAVPSAGGVGGVTATSPKLSPGGTAEGGPEMLAKGSSSRKGEGELHRESSGVSLDLDLGSAGIEEGVVDDELEDPGRLGADCERLLEKLEAAADGWVGVGGGWDCRNEGIMMECKDRRFFNGSLSSIPILPVDLVLFLDSPPFEELFSADARRAISGVSRCAIYSIGLESVLRGIDEALGVAFIFGKGNPTGASGESTINGES